MTSNFYNRILHKIESYLTASKTINTQSPTEIKKSLSFSPHLSSFISAKKLSTTLRLKRLASSIESIPPNKSLVRSNSIFTNNRPKREGLEDRLHEERMKNSRYLSEISSLKMQIECLNKQQHCHRIDCNENRDKLIRENEELRKFKDTVFSISKRYDEINKGVLISLKEMDQLFAQMNEAGEGMTYFNKMGAIESSINTFENVINTLEVMMKSKQDEYNFLIGTRENEIKQLCYHREQLEDYICKLEASLHIHHHFEDGHKCHSCLKNVSLCTCYYGHHCSSPEEKYIAQRLKRNNSCDALS